MSLNLPLEIFIHFIKCTFSLDIGINLILPAVYLVKTHSYVQVTPQGNYDVKYWVTDVSTKGFTIKIDPALSEEVQFSWSALAVKDAKTYEGNESSATPDPTVTYSPIPGVEPIEESTTSAEVETPPSTQSATVSQ